MTTDADEDKEYEYLRGIAEQYGLTSSTWSVADVDLFSKHPFTAHKMALPNYRLEGSVKPFIEVPIEGDQWIDLWKAADKLIKHMGYIDHRFIELYYEEGGVVSFFLGS